MRIFPIRYDEAYVGIGDFYAANLANPLITEPTERVDMVNGRLRIRELPNNPEHTGPYRVMVVDDSPAPSAERGVVKWATLPTNPGGADCDWTLLGGVNNNNVVTAVGASTTCPNDANLVGVGTTNPWAKLHVRMGTSSGVSVGTAGLFNLDGIGGKAGEFIVNGPASANIGVNVSATGAQSSLWTEGNIGLRSNATANVAGYTYSNRAYEAIAGVASGVQVKDNFILDGQTILASGSSVVDNYGIRAKLWNYGTATNNYGGHFWSWAPQGLLTNSYGIKALAEGGANNYGLHAYAPVSPTSIAAYVHGSGVITDGPWGHSDAGLKIGIEDVAPEDAASKLDLLRVHTYAYNTEEYPYMGLPMGNQVGLLAQELEEVLPELVMEVNAPEHRDREGNLLQASMPIKVVNQTALIPYLITGHQAQQREMESLRVAMQELREQLAACCANPSSDHRMAPTPANASADELLLGQERLLRIAPNPFTDRTTLYYTTERSGRVQLLANSADGRDLRILSEAQREAGAYQFEWSTENLAPGVYYVTLLLDGEPLVKRAMKVGR
ncbi:MAG: tail fiber domain-containing protein [Flavobacteriales bacterium]|nr:tail fiber domain-containing protein [Flavobacteriales bacterium]